MQHFINYAVPDRILGEVLAGARARYFMMALLAGALAAAVGAPVAATWLGLALLVGEGQKAFDQGAPLNSAASASALSATLAAAPALAWFARTEFGAPLAIAMLIALAGYLVTQEGVKAKPRWSLAPIALTALAFVIDSGVQGDFTAAALVALCAGYTVANFLYAARAAESARLQDAEWVRQLNMTFGAAGSAAWEINFQTQTIAGAERLEALLGRPVTYADIVETGCFAAAADKSLVQATFRPGFGPMRRIAIEHDFVGADGSTGRIRHQGFLRVNPDGSPARLTCISEPARAEATTSAAIDLSALLAHTQHILQEQAHSILVIGNELDNADRTGIPSAAPNAPHPDQIIEFRRRIETIERQSAVLADCIDDLVKAHHTAHEASLAKSQFLASMSHELRTPLNAIIGYAEMLQEDAADNGDETAIQDLNRILTAARHLLSLIGEILDLSKIEAGRIDVASAPFEIDELLRELTATMHPLAEQNENQITTRIQTSELVLNTDATKLRQCVLNLLSNACKFTQKGQIDILVDRRLLHGVPQIFITVADTGIGMTDEQMSRLFQPFVQADPSITQKYGGTGLGLTITRRLAQLLGGDVTVRSEHGRGATFTLHIPADFADAAAALGSAAQVDPRQGPENAPLVIVIEDEPDARELAARALTRAGFAVQGVGGGEAGLALARAKAPALILLDIFLPDRSGWRVLQNLKHDPKTSEIPVVVLSVNEDRAHALALGAAEHIIKPADRDMLAATVMRLARGRPDLAAAVQTPTRRKAR